jgi:hypothetical protein
MPKETFPPEAGSWAWKQVPELLLLPGVSFLKGSVRGSLPYPRRTEDEATIVCHAGGKLYLYTLEDSSTRKVSTDDRANYIYPHGQATPKQ